MKSPTRSIQSENLDTTSRLARGSNFEYMGATLVVVDITGDGLEEVIIGSPMYSRPRTSMSDLVRGDTGRIVIYTLDGWKQLQTVEGNATGARFGSTIANIGDINDDDFNGQYYVNVDHTIEKIWDRYRGWCSV